VRIPAFLFACWALVGLCGCGDADPGSSSGSIRSPRDLVGKTVGAVTGSTIQMRTEKYQSGLKYMSFNDYVSAVEALRRGKIAAMPMEKMMADIWVAKCPGEFRLSDVYIDNDMGYFLRKGSPLLKPMNDVLERLHASGEMQRLYQKWCGTGHPESCTLENWPRPGFTGRKGILRFAVDGEHEPGAFSMPKGVVGLDIDIANRLANELDMTLEIVRVSLPALVVSVQCGKADFGGGNMSITEERLKLVDFTIPTVRGGYVLLLPTGKKVEKTANAGSSLAASFRRTFVIEDRWKMLAKGLGITLALAALASFFGTLLAFPVWRARTSTFAPIACLAKWYVSVLQGTPLLVLLMILFYLVFGNVNLDGLWVAVIGFSLNCSAYVGEMLRSGIDGVPRGQTEAALALGYGPRAAFFRFVLPQAVRQILPMYRGQLIGLLKNTSIVGYIAISDLTKASDLVRSRTYESFFPILTTAFIYFVAAWLLAAALDRFGRRLDPAHRRLCEQDKKGGGGR